MSRTLLLQVTLDTVEEAVLSALQNSHNNNILVDFCRCLLKP